MGADKQQALRQEGREEGEGARGPARARDERRPTWVERPREAAGRPPQARRRRRPRPPRRAPRRAPAPACSRDVDLTLHGGERVAITGANGAGKTTLLQLLLGTLEPSDGAVQTATSVRLLPQRPQDVAATGPLLPVVPPPQPPRHRRVRGAHAARPLRPRRRRGPPAARAPQPRASARARRSPPSSPPRPTCCCSTSRPTTSTSTRSRCWRPRWPRARARSSPSPTTAGSSTRSAPRATCTSRTDAVYEGSSTSSRE